MQAGYHQRIEHLGQTHNLRIQLLIVSDPIRELTKVCQLCNITIIVAWSPGDVREKRKWRRTA